MSIETLKSRIEGEQTAFQSVNGKYKHVPLYKDEGFDVTEHEYINPKNEKGYQIILWKNELGKDYIKSFGYGKESVSRTFDWREIKPDA